MLTTIRILLTCIILSMMQLAMALTLQGKPALEQLRQTKSCVNCDLRALDLSNMDLAGANLEDANLSGANLTNTNLRGANLQGAILLDTNLFETLLSGANLKNTDMSDIDIDLAFESIEIIGTMLEGARFKYGVICGPAPNKGGWGCQHN